MWRFLVAPRDPAMSCKFPSDVANTYNHVPTRNKIAQPSSKPLGVIRQAKKKKKEPSEMPRPKYIRPLSRLAPLEYRTVGLATRTRPHSWCCSRFGIPAISRESQSPRMKCILLQSSNLVPLLTDCRFESPKMFAWRRSCPTTQSRGRLTW